MKKIASRLIFGFLGLTTLGSMVGAISGTVAWYAYVTRATMSYSGTSVNSTKQLQIGIKSPVAVTFPTGTISETLPVLDGTGGYYYFMSLGASLPASVISAYLEANHYATTTLEPVSTYTYANDGSAINLRNSPTTNKPFQTRTAAEITKYVEIPFALRVLESDLITPTYVKNKPVYITDADAQAASSSDGDVYKAIRLFIDRKDGLDDFLFNPSSEENGRTKVAGILDISGDDLFDYVNDMSSPYFGAECLYGDYTLNGKAPGEDGFQANYLAALTSGSDETSGFINANLSDVDDGTKRTTFTAKHYEHIDYFDLPTLADNGTFVPAYAYYYGTNTVYPHVNDYGDLEGDYAVCVTANNTDNNRYCIGEFNMKVFIEGWDFNVIDEELAHSFNLGLTFEIN